jgi:hypothetical protein
MSDQTGGQTRGPTGADGGPNKARRGQTGGQTRCPVWFCNDFAMVLQRFCNDERPDGGPDGGRRGARQGQAGAQTGADGVPNGLDGMPDRSHVIGHVIFECHVTHLGW